MFYYICYPFAALLRLCYNLTNSYGVSLILFTLAVKLVMMPFQMKSQKSMVRMNRMNSQIQEIQKKYANNPRKQQEELQKFYTEQGVNPMGGCLWSFLPLPILIALYNIIREPIVYFMNFGTKANGQAVLEAAKKVISDAGITLNSNAGFEQIEIINIINEKFPSFIAEHENWISLDYSFIGINLQTIPTEAFGALKNGITWGLIGLILIPLISGVLSFFQSKVAMMGQKGSSNSTTNSMMWMMPMMSVWIGFTLPAALGVYWIANSLFSIIQEYFMGKFYNAKLEAEEDERQRRLEEDRRKRQEEGRLMQEKRAAEAEKKLTLKEKQRAAQEAKSAKKRVSTTEAGRVGERPYARGRSYVADRYDDK